MHKLHCIGPLYTVKIRLNASGVYYVFKLFPRTLIGCEAFI